MRLGIIILHGGVTNMVNVSLTDKSAFHILPPIKSKFS